MKRSPVLAALIVIGLSGCGPGVSPVSLEGASPEVATPSTVRERLELESKEFRAVPQLTTGELLSRRVQADVSSAVSLGVADGWFEARAANDATGARLDVSRFELALRDVKLSAAQFPPNGLTLTRVSLELEQPAALDLRWYGDGNLGWAGGDASFALQLWVKLSNGNESPLETAHIDVPIELMVTADEAGALNLSLDLSHQGAMWQIPTLFELRDLKLTVNAVETTPLDQLPPRQVLQ